MEVLKLKNHSPRRPKQSLLRGLGEDERSDEITAEASRQQARGHYREE